MRPIEAVVVLHARDVKFLDEIVGTTLDEMNDALGDRDKPFSEEEHNHASELGAQFKQLRRSLCGDS